MQADLHVISWNLHGVPTAPKIGARLRAAADYIGGRRPDLVLLQEVSRTRHRDLLASELDGYAMIRTPVRPLVGPKGGLLAFLRADSV